MQRKLARIAALSLPDADVSVLVDSKNKSCIISFNGAWESEYQVYSNGSFILHGWDSTKTSSPHEIIANTNIAPLIERVCEHEFIGSSFLMRGFSPDGGWHEWIFENVSNVEFIVTQQYQWIQNEFGGHEEYVSIPMGLPPLEPVPTRIMLETPVTDNIELDIAYAKACLDDCWHLDELPYIPYVLEYTSITDTDINVKSTPDYIQLARDVWLESAHAMVVYVDFGTTSAMDDNIIKAIRLEKPIRFRRLFGLTDAQKFMEACHKTSRNKA